MSFEEFERIARANESEENLERVSRRSPAGRRRLRRAEIQVDSDKQRRALGGPWWEKEDVRKLPPAPKGWPVDW